MNSKSDFHPGNDSKDRSQRGLIVLGVIAMVAGMGTGLVGAWFRLALEKANEFRDALISRTGGWRIGGFLLFVGLAAVTAASAAWLVRRIAPTAAGSGIPRIMLELDGELPPAPPLVTPSNFWRER